jgi:hypothetical protein
MMVVRSHGSSSRLMTVVRSRACDQPTVAGARQTHADCYAEGVSSGLSLGSGPVI